MVLEFIFDVDDTLIYNQYMYTKVYADFIGFMLKKINAKPSIKEHSDELLEIIKQTSPRCKGVEEIIKIHNLDSVLGDIFRVADNLNKKGAEDTPENPYNKERVPNAFKKAYFELCSKEKYGCISSDSEAQEAYEIGKGFHNIKKDLVEGAEALLESIKEKGYKRKILTCGDLWLQQKKIEVNGFDRYFDKKDMIIVPRKDTGAIKNYIKGCDPHHTFMVGNSIKSDINPALKAGIMAIYFPSVTFYSWEDAQIDEKRKSKVITINNLEWIKDNYDFLSSLK